MAHNGFSDKKRDWKLRGRMTAGASIVALTLAFGAVTTAVLVPAVAHAQLFGDEDEEEDLGRPATPAGAWDEKRLQRLDRNVRKLERAVARTENKKNPPILIEPDPEVVALQATVDSLSRKQDEQGEVIIRLTGQLEEALYANQQLQGVVNAQNARIDVLTRRADVADAHMKDIEAMLAPPPPPPASTGTAEGDFDQAFALMTSGQTDDAGRAFESFTATWPEATQLPEAWFRLGQIRSMKQDASGAVAAYATALKGWPKTSWAPEATVRLAGALTDSNRPTDACLALAQFDKLYAKTATNEHKTMAKTLKAKDKCPA
ncbi:tetratricopeptide repeat protein [Asticcacaulis sp. AC402]|uniref:tetratricopeptide repeat protein n=1 Tax=Asticcacaulis sp. AC402 TaxID=1282361 RepID=UPI0003C3D8AB|nr:tetratricopeptide repeat protein [Asticcacaulis sp. AC402]ESQ75547.1 tol-pal system protein ybgf [Asticcacaulis sp. AC402]